MKPNKAAKNLLEDKSCDTCLHNYNDLNDNDNNSRCAKDSFSADSEYTPKENTCEDWTALTKRPHLKLKLIKLDDSRAKLGIAKFNSL